MTCTTVLPYAAFTPDTCSPDTSCIHLYLRVYNTAQNLYPSTCIWCKCGFTQKRLQAAATLSTERVIAIASIGLLARQALSTVLLICLSFVVSDASSVHCNCIRDEFYPSDCSVCQSPLTYNARTVECQLHLFPQDDERPIGTARK